MVPRAETQEDDGGDSAIDEGEEEEIVSSDVDADEDLEALVRSRLGEGERVVDEDDVPEEEVEASKNQWDPENKTIYLADMLEQKIKDIQYQVPEGAKRVPWVDTLAIDNLYSIDKKVKMKEGVKLESEFMRTALKTTSEAFRRLQVMKIPCNRPMDFMAEMFRADSTMYKVKQLAAEETRRIKIVENRKRGQAEKKMAKQVRAERLKAKAVEKNKTLNSIDKWKADSKKNNVDKDGLDKAIAGKYDARKKSKNQERDAKFGKGGRKTRFNDVHSVNDMSAFDGKVGKGKGGKGKGKGKGQKGKSGGVKNKTSKRR